RHGEVGVAVAGAGKSRREEPQRNTDEHGYDQPCASIRVPLWPHSLHQKTACMPPKKEMPGSGKSPRSRTSALPRLTASKRSCSHDSACTLQRTVWIERLGTISKLSASVGFAET